MKGKKSILLFTLIMILFIPACLEETPAEKITPTSFIEPPVIELTDTPIADDSSIRTVLSKPIFQVFILNPVKTCLAGNDFASGDACFGEKCGDCNCKWEDFDPPAPMVGINPSQIDGDQYQDFAYKACYEITLTEQEVADIKSDMQQIRDQVYEWSGNALDIQLKITELPFNHTGFVAPEFVFGPFEVDDELLNPYVDIDTDFVYVVTGVHDRDQGVNLAYACGGSYGEMSIHGAGYANIQYNEICNRFCISGRQVYEPLIHEWIHNLDWALYNVNLVPDMYQNTSPDWANWQHSSWPSCATQVDPLSYFPSIDYCEWDPDWMDCNDKASAGFCPHAGEVNGNISWYEHVIREHFPRDLAYVGNYCRDGYKDITETGVDSGWPCP
jgi:hypothetical protein